jgi:transaldolase
MKFFIDSADPDEIRRAIESNLVSGVTTNPGLFGRQGRGRNPREALEGILAAAAGRPVFVQLLRGDAAGQVEEAKRLSGMGENITFKVILGEESLKSIPSIASLGLKVAATTVNSVGRALLAANAGAHFVIPYYGWIEQTVDRSTNLVADIAAIYKAGGYETELVSYARDLRHVLESALAGAHACTLEPENLRKLFFHPQSEVAVGDHRSAWEARFGKVTWLEVLGTHDGSTKPGGES